MSMESRADQDPVAALSAYLRIAVSELLSIFVLSILFTLASLSIVTMGAAFISLIDTFYSSVTFTGSGGGVPPRTSDRANHFVSQIWTYLKTGLAYTVILILALVGLLTYFNLALRGGSFVTIVFGVAGIYATTIVLVILGRAANILAHAEDDKPGIRRAVGEAWTSMRENLPYAGLHVVVAATIVLVCRAIPVLMPVALPALLALLEVLMYEELRGVGAETVKYAYQDPQS